MKTIFSLEWDQSQKYLSLIDFEEDWIKIGNIYKWYNPPRIVTNNDKKKNGDTCFDISIQISYLVFSYTNYNLQKGWI